jgi:Uma2 family endonuclease
MSARPHTRLTEEQYLAIERAAEFKSEYYDGHMYAVSGGSASHAQIIGNLTRELGNALRQKPCGVMLNDLRVRVPPARFYTYPDVAVVCGPMQFADDQKDTLLNPTLLIEVLSTSTESHDRAFKFDRYAEIESLREVALVSQFTPRVEIFRRQQSNQWLFSVVTGVESVCGFESVGATIPLLEIYHRIEFSPVAPQMSLEI